MFSRHVCRTAGNVCKRPTWRASQKRFSSIDSRFLKISAEVREALHAKRPVVALETTIYTHGYPYPDNIALASELESIVRVNGGVPATIGIVDGVAKVGLSPEELIELGSSAGKDTTLKLSRRDLSYVLGSRLVGKRYHGGTTIAGTMILAHLAGIKIFATGGLGGVHRGAESSMDISADLTELGRTPVTVISSGCKSFLDIPRTLEYLETEGAVVGTFADGREGKVDFPQFWSRDSGIRSPLTISDEKEAAAIIYAHLNLPLTSGLALANPIPSEYSIPREEMDIVIKQAIAEADAAGATGNDNTPFILSKIKELSKGNSLAANRALICSNVKRGTIVAKELAALEAQMEGHNTLLSAFSRPSPVFSQSVSTSIDQHRPTAAQESRSLRKDFPPPGVIVSGALAVDYACDFAPFSPGTTAPQMTTSNPGVIVQTLGGVAHNVAKTIHRLGTDVQLISMIGDDLDGESARAKLETEGMRIDGIEHCADTEARTARYVAVNDAKKDLVVAVADMNLLNTHGGPVLESKWKPQIVAQPPKYFVADANWEPHLLRDWLETAKGAGCVTALEPVSTAKGARIFSKSAKVLTSSVNSSLPVFPNHLIDIISPNSLELTTLYTTAREQGRFDLPDHFPVIDALGIPSSGIRSRLVDASSKTLVDQGIPQQAIQLLPFMPCITTKLGPDGVLLTMLLPRDDARLQNPDAAPWIISRSGPEHAQSGVGGVYMRLYAPAEVIPEDQIASVNGVGDTFLGALIAGLFETGKGVDELIPFAQKAAVLTLKSKEAVSPELGKTLRIER